ncbi:MAG: lipid-A-disaccharide synthase [Elusimicrobiota bacterium]|jgi:lipid-A-disaccharide synthase
MRLLVVAGDPSGDLYGSLLLRALKTRRSDLRVDAVGGALMRAAAEETGGEFLHDLAGMGLTGFVEPLRRIPHLFALRRTLAARMRTERPDALVVIDYYGFNRHVLAAGRDAGVKTLYYVSPQVWASRPGRIRVLRGLVDRMIVIFPFEEELYRAQGVPVTWVGHPLLDLLPAPRDPDASGDGTLRLGLLPGSRASELARHLPVLLPAAERVLKSFPRSELSVFAAPQAPDALYTPHLAAFERRTGRAVRLVRDRAYAERARLDLALCSSGTATLENALLGVPMVVVYRLSWPTYALARALVHVRNIAMANLLAGRTLVPELIQHEATPERIADAALDLLAEPRRLAALRRELAALREKLGGPGATGRAAAAVLEAAVGPAPAREEVRA